MAITMPILILLAVNLLVSDFAARILKKKGWTAKLISFLIFLGLFSVFIISAVLGRREGSLAQKALQTGAQVAEPMRLTPAC